MNPRQPLIMCTRGLPASGKTTWAHAVTAILPHTVKAISFDEIRTILVNPNVQFNQRDEQTVQDTVASTVVSAVQHGFDVIVHNTHLHPKFPKRLQRLMSGEAQIMIVDFTDVNVDVCVQRNLNRENPVPADAMDRMINDLRKVKLPSSWIVLTPDEAFDVLSRGTPTPAFGEEPYVPDLTLPTAVLVDLDGTLAKHDGRDPYNASACDTDIHDNLIAQAANSLGVHVVLLSGRDSKFRPETEAWLKTNDWLLNDGTVDYWHERNYDALIMRPADDFRPDHDVKWELFQKHIAPHYNVKLAFDDRDSVVAMWRRHGIPCWQVAPGDF